MRATPPLVEVCLSDPESALRAFRGGARRVEMCSDLANGGVTPGPDVIESTIEAHRREFGTDAGGVVALLRPRPGDFCYSGLEYRALERGVAFARRAGCQAVALGVLLADGHVDVDRTRSLVEMARPMEVTFHRAFDLTPDLDEAFDALLGIGVDRVLTSAGAPSAWDGRDKLRALTARAPGRITVVTAGAITLENAPALVKHTGAVEIHVGSAVTELEPDPETDSAPGSSVGLGPRGRPTASREARVSTDAVRRLIRSLGGAEQGRPRR